MKSVYLLIPMLFLSQLLVAQSALAFVDVATDPSSSSAVNLVENFSTNFELEGGLIVVRATLDGQMGDYVLDTGAEGLILNQKVAEGGEKAIGINEEILAASTPVNSFMIGNFRLSDFTAFKTDLSFLEMTIGQKIDGLIGSSVFGSHTLCIDYQNKIFQLEPCVSKQSMKKAGWQHFPLASFGHMLGVKLSINGTNCWMALDTGAEINIISDKNLKGSRSKEFNKKEVAGLGGQKMFLSQVPILDASIGQLPLLLNDLYFSSNNNIKQQLGSTVDGLLGFPFFQQFEVRIDYKNKRLYLR